MADLPDKNNAVDLELEPSANPVVESAQTQRIRLPIYQPPKASSKKLLFAALTAFFIGAVFTWVMRFTVLATTESGVQPDVTNGAEGPYIKPGQAISLNTGAQICIPNFDETVYFDFQGRCIFDDSNDSEKDRLRLPIEAGQQITVQHKGVEYSIYNKSCDMEKRSSKSNNGSEGGFSRGIVDGITAPRTMFLIGCNLSINQSSTLSMPRKLTKSFTMSQETSPSKYYSENPLLYSTGRGSLGQVWKSTKCKDHQFCSYLLLNDQVIDDTGEDARTIEFATRRGVASFKYTPKEIYDKVTKTIRLDNATATFKINSMSYECAQYCDTDDSWDKSGDIAASKPSADPKGQLFNSFKTEFSYVEEDAR